MTLEQIAQETMDYLDSVGVAADWEIVNHKVPFASYVDILHVYTDAKRFTQIDGYAITILEEIRKAYTQNPAVILKEIYLGAGIDIDEDRFTEAIKYMNQKSPN